MSDSRDILMIISTGKEDGGRKATIGFALAVSSLMSGIKTSIFLTGNGTTWGLPEQTKHVSIDGFESLGTYVEEFFNSEGRLMICSPCLKFFCGIEDAEKSKTNGGVHEGAEFVGFATIADMASTCSVLNF